MMKIKFADLFKKNYFVPEYLFRMSDFVRKIEFLIFNNIFYY